MMHLVIQLRLILVQKIINLVDSYKILEKHIEIIMEYNMVGIMI